MSLRRLFSWNVRSRGIDKALLQARQLAVVDSPRQRDVKFLRDWHIRPKMGNNFLVGNEQTILDDSNSSDLISLQPQDDERDAFTSMLDGTLLTLYHRIYGHKRTVRTLSGSRAHVSLKFNST